MSKRISKIDRQISKETKSDRRRHTEVIEMSNDYLYRRAFSELRLLDICPKIEAEKSYCFITGGDVDQLSFLKLILRYKKTLDYCLFSTWRMLGDDVLQLRKWVENGTIKKMDAYVGEIFPNQYKMEWMALNRMFDELKCGRIAVFRNHSKIFAGYNEKEKFYFGIQGSANINTNPRTENACIICKKDIFDFYKQYFDGINSII